MKKETPPREDVRAVLAALDARIAELTERDKALLAEQLALEAAHVLPVSDSAKSTGVDVERYLDAGVITQTADNSDNARLRAVMEERDLIGRALHLAGQRAFRLRVANEAQLAGDIYDRARKNVVKAVAAVCVLRDLAHERARLRAEYAGRTGMVLPIPAGIAADKFCGEGVFADAAQAFIDAARRAGVE